MRDSGDVDPEPILAIDVPGRPIAAAPTRETRKIAAILSAVGR
jgi:hypothetical protein